MNPDDKPKKGRKGIIILGAIILAVTILGIVVCRSEAKQQRRKPVKMLYVDHARIPYGRMLMSHLLADTPEELERARTALGLPLGAVQHPGTEKEHLDICEMKRKAALAMGAKPVAGRDLVNIIRARRQTNPQRAPY